VPLQYEQEETQPAMLFVNSSIVQVWMDQMLYSPALNAPGEPLKDKFDWEKRRCGLAGTNGDLPDLPYPSKSSRSERHKQDDDDLRSGVPTYKRALNSSNR